MGTSSYTNTEIKFIIKRDGAVTEFNAAKIEQSISKAFFAVYQDTKSEEEINQTLNTLLPKMLESIINTHNKTDTTTIEIEKLQDLIERTLFEYNVHDVGKAYITHRTKRAIVRDLSVFQIYVQSTTGMKHKYTTSDIFQYVKKIVNIQDPVASPEDVSYDSKAENITQTAITYLKDIYHSSVNYETDMPPSISNDVFEESIAKAMATHNCFFLFKQFLLSSSPQYPASSSVVISKQDKHSSSNKTIVKGVHGEDMIMSPFFIKHLLETASKDNVSIDIPKITKAIFDGFSPEMKFEDVIAVAIKSTKHLIEQSPKHSYTIAQILLAYIYYSAGNVHLADPKAYTKLRKRFKSYIAEGIEHEMLDPRLLTDFDLDRLTNSLDFTRDKKFKYMGLQTLRDRYLIKNPSGKIIETPQYMWMRVAMGLALNEQTSETKTEWAIKFYNLISDMRYMPSTPTLFNAGTRHPQLSSCYISTTQDSLDSIFKTISDNAQMSKWAGGIGNDWTPVRGVGSKIKGTNGQSNGVIPFLKIVNSATVAVNQGGKRNGSTSVYIEPWHIDIEAFLSLRKNTGDERLRTLDIHTVLWFPDLFFERAFKRESWSLFCPSETPDLHDLYGEDFKKRYEHYEKLAQEGLLHHVKTLNAFTFWRHILSVLYETGHPWITFKDSSNIRNPQKHAGVIHSSNLCTEVFLNTSEDEIAVCNLGSINLAEHVVDSQIDWEKLAETTTIAIRALDNVIDNGFFPVPEARRSSTLHRPIGLGMCGLADLFLRLRISFNSSESIEHSDILTEFISYKAIEASAKLAEEKGSYSSFQGSLWSKGKVPLDTLIELKEYRGALGKDIDVSNTMDWDYIRSVVKKGMRNSVVMAIAPTVTISNIMGVNDSIAPIYGVAFTKTNLSGAFTCICDEAYNILNDYKIWNTDMVSHIKYHDGSIKHAQHIPDVIKNLLSTAFEIPATLLVKATARRQKWVDQGISLNLFFASPDGNFVQETYELAWSLGLKSTYYAKQREATNIEKATLDLNALSLRPRWMKQPSATDNIITNRTIKQTTGQSSSLCDEDTCLSCQ